VTDAAEPQPPADAGLACPPAVTAAPPPARGLAWSPDHVPLQDQLPAPSAVEVDHGYWQIMSRSLIRAQLGLSLVCLAFALAVTASVPILYAVRPGLDRVKVFGLPLALVVLGAGIYPVILIIAIFYNHQAGRLEQRFISMADRVDEPADE
jgi:putative solute:sodium symporter small subunit